MDSGVQNLPSANDSNLKLEQQLSELLFCHCYVTFTTRIIQETFVVCD